MNRGHAGRRLLAVLSVGGIALVGAILAGCATPSSPADIRAGAQFVGEDAYQARYREVVRDFPEKMPPGVAFPASARPLEPGAETQLSGADSQAYFFWNCAWEKTYLEAMTPADRRESMAQLRRFPHTSWARDWVRDPEHGHDKELDAAELGDTSGLAEDFESCSGFGLTLGKDR